MQNTEQRTIFGESIDEQVRIETTGRAIRPFKRMLDQVADEYKLRFADDGVSTRVVDPANVIMIENKLHASAFESYDLAKDTTLGISGSEFGSVLQHARYGISTDDPITITADSRKIQSHVERSVGEASATVSERASLIDPDSIRQEPDLPELDFDTDVDIDPSTFIEAIRMMDDDSFISLSTTDDSLTFGQKGDLQQRNIEIDCSPTGAVGETMYTADYIHHFKDAFNNGYVDDITMHFAEEFPLIVDFEREDIMSGRMMVAPRIRAE